MYPEDQMPEAPQTVQAIRGIGAQHTMGRDNIRVAGNKLAQAPLADAITKTQ